MAAWSALRGAVRRLGLVTVAIAAVVAAVAAGALVTGIALSRSSEPAAPALAASGRPVVEQVAVGDAHPKVVVVPHRPGPNLVWVDGPDYRVGTVTDDLVPAARRLGAPGGWAVLNLPAGPSTLWVEHGGQQGAVLLDAEPGAPLPALTTPDGPECLTAAVGAAIAGASLTSCPAQTLTAADTRALRGMIRSIADRRIPGIRLVGGTSPRAQAAEHLVRHEAATLKLPIENRGVRRDARVVVGDWSTAEQALTLQATDPATSGVYLAPWLANPTLLGYSTGAIVALNYDTTQGAAAEYVAALDRFAAGQLASPAGFDAWLHARGRATPTGPTRLYAAMAGFDMMGVDPAMHSGSGMGGMPGMGGSGGTDSTDGSAVMAGGPAVAGGWIPGGRMTPVSKPLDTSSSR